MKKQTIEEIIYSNVALHTEDSILSMIDISTHSKTKRQIHFAFFDFDMISLRSIREFEKLNEKQRN